MAMAANRTENTMSQPIQLVLTYTLRDDGATWTRHIAAPGNEAAVKEWQASKANGDVAKLMRKVGVENRIALSIYAVTNAIVVPNKE